MKIIIVGCGKIGKSLIESLVSEGHDVAVIDKDPSVIEEATNTFDVIGLCGIGTDCEVLTEAGAAKADIVISVTGSDELNMLSSNHFLVTLQNPLLLSLPNLFHYHIAKLLLPEDAHFWFPNKMHFL